MSPFFDSRCRYSRTDGVLSGLASAVSWLCGRLLRTADDRDDDDGLVYQLFCLSVCLSVCLSMCLCPSVFVYLFMFICSSVFVSLS